MADWPIVGRAVEIQLVLKTMEPASDFCGAVLIGETGVGKTVLAHSLGAALESAGLRTRFVLGTETGQHIPMGAFHRLVPVDEAHTPAVMLARAHRALSEDANLVVVVDDAQWLDHLSAILINQLAADGRARLLVTVRSDDPVPDAVRTLWKDRQLLRVDLKAFTRTQTGELVHEVLGGPVEHVAVDQLHDLTAGNPLLLRALITAALEDRVLLQRDGRWGIAGPFRVDAALDDLAQRRVESLGPVERNAIEIIAAAEALDWEVLRELCDVEVIVNLERRGLIQFTGAGAHAVVRLAHPILGEAVLQRAGFARTRQLNSMLSQQISQLIRRGAGKPDVRLEIQLAHFMLDSDIPPDVGLIVRAARGAVTLLNLALAEKLARFAYDRGGGVAAATVLGLALSWQGRADEAEQLMMAVIPDDVDEPTVVGLGCVRAMNLFFGCGRIQAATEVLGAIRTLVRPTALDPVVAMDVSFAFFGADVSTAITSGRRALESGVGSLAAVQAATAAGCALALAGRHDEVPQIVGYGQRAAEVRECGLQRFTIGFPEVLAVTVTGDLDAADRMCAHYSALAAGAPVAGAIVNAFIGRVAYLHGQLAAACDALQQSLATLSESFPLAWITLVAAWRAEAEAARGDAQAAGLAVAQARAAAGPQVAVFIPELELAQAWTAAGTGETMSARAHALRAASIARRAGLDAVEMDARHTAVRFGERGQAGRLGELKRRLATPLAAAIAGHARGAADHDGDLLDEVAVRLESIGVLAMAADAAAHAAAEHARTARRAAELESAARARRLAGRCGLRSPAVARITNPLPLTDREREIATLVATGLTNRQIADRLCLSFRTVEGHLYRIFTKLGIGDRDHLAHLVRVGAAR